MPETTSKQLSQNPIKKYSKQIKLASGALLLLFLVLFILWMRQAVEIYRNAQEYKKFYDRSREQLEFCQSPKVKQGEDATIIVHYCDELKERFSM